MLYLLYKLGIYFICIRFLKILSVLRDRRLKTEFFFFKYRFRKHPEQSPLGLEGVLLKGKGLSRFHVTKWQQIAGIFSQKLLGTIEQQALEEHTVFLGNCSVDNHGPNPSPVQSYWYCPLEKVDIYSPKSLGKQIGIQKFGIRLKQMGILFLLTGLMLWVVQIYLKILPLWKVFPKQPRRNHVIYPCIIP